MMKRRISIFLVFILSLGLAGGSEVHAQPLSPDSTPLFSKKQLQELAAPIALYPDPLLAQVLAASTYPLDIVVAARLLEGHPDPSQIEKQGWDSSVKAVARSPEVLAMMYEKLEWTQKLGQAFLSQPKDVMAAIQTLRRKAQKRGNLKTTPEQDVVVQDENIQILPAESKVIYVPQYDPYMVYEYSAAEVAVPLFTFSTGLIIGSWFNLGCDWWGGNIYYGGPYYWGYPWHYGPYGGPWHGRPWYPPPPPAGHPPSPPPPWKHNPTRAGPFPGTPYGPRTWGPVVPKQGTGPFGKTVPGMTPFSQGLDRPNATKTNVFGGMGDGVSTTINSNRGGQSTGGGGFRNFSPSYSPTGRGFSPSWGGGSGWGGSKSVPGGGGFQGGSRGGFQGGGSTLRGGGMRGPGGKR